MMHTPIPGMWSALWADMHDPGILWQLAALLICVGAGWGLARLLRQAVVPGETGPKMLRFGVEGFARVMAPLLVLGLLLMVKPVLGIWHHVNLLRVAIPLVASFALIRLVFHVLRRAFAGGDRLGSVLLMFEKGFATLVWGTVAMYITGLWPGLLGYLDNTVVPIGRYHISLLAILQASLSVGVTLILALWAGALLEERLMRIDSMHTSLRVVMGRMVRATLILLAVLLSLSLVGIDLTVLSVFGGALGVGIGLGLQKIVSSYVSGFVILLERSLTIGDMVMVDGKYYGQVTQINTRYTIVRSLDGIESVIPNEMLVSGPVQNYSLSDSRLRLSTRVTVGYETDIEILLPLLEQSVGSIQRVLKDPPVQALLTRFGDDGLELEIGFWINDPENGRGNLMSEINRVIWRTLQLHRVNVPYPQRELRVIDFRAAQGEAGAFPQPIKSAQ